MTIGIVVPSAVVAFIAWAKANPQITAQVNQRVSSSLPTAGLVFPWVQVRRITGVAQIPDMPMDFARVQINVWGGRTANGQPDYATADLPARVIEAEIRAFRGEKVGDAFISEMTPFEGMQQLDDPESGYARFWMDARVVVRRADGQ